MTSSDFCKIVDGHDPSICTKRIVLSITAKFFDPLGLISPVILQLKLLFHELCKSNVGWDEQLSEQCCQVVENDLFKFEGSWCIFHSSLLF